MGIIFTLEEYFDIGFNISNFTEKLVSAEEALLNIRPELTSKVGVLI